jgi:mannose-6-phosphate isomerase-like protein (cupin superfamily)
LRERRSRSSVLTVRRFGVPTERGIESTLGTDWIESPRTGAKLKRYVAPAGEEEPAGPALSVVRLLRQGMGRFRAHVHLDFAERFVVTQGAAIAEFDGDELRITADAGRSTLYIPAGVPHVNPYNDEADDLVFRQSFMPPTEGSRSYVETLAAVLADGRDEGGELPWPLILAVGDVTHDRTYLTPTSRRARRANALSFTLQRRILLPVGSLVAGLRDYKVHLDG